MRIHTIYTFKCVSPQALKATPNHIDLVSGTRWTSSKVWYIVTAAGALRIIKTASIWRIGIARSYRCLHIIICELNKN